MSLAHYLLQVNIYLVIFYCFYKLFLDSETYFVLNRVYLLGSAGLSLAIPFLRFEWFSKQEVAQPIYIGVEQINNFVTQVSVVDDTATRFNWGNFIVMAYLMGIVVCIGRLAFQLLAVRKLITTLGNGTAFSFFRKKIISSNVPELATVNLHEDVHVKQLHSIDVLFFEVLGIFSWFNPIIYAYKKTIKNIHEYLADEAAAKFQGDKEAYALLLLSQAFGVRPNTLTNGFFTKSLIKKRILMLHKKRSKKTAIIKYGMFVPLFALTLVLSSATIRKNNQILAIADKIPLENARTVVNEAIATPLSIVSFTKPASKIDDKSENTQVITLVPTKDVTTNEPESTRFLNVFYSYLGARIKYPTAAIEKKIQGNTIINFTVKNGRILDAIVQNELPEGCDEEVLGQILNYHGYFQKDGNYSLKVTFKLSGSDTELKNENIAPSPDYTALQNMVVTALPLVKENEADQNIYSFVSMEQPPTYPGGIEQFYKFLGTNIKYPQAAIDNEIKGNVHVSFTVEKDGSLSDIKVERKLGFGTDEEALRVLKLTKRWNPGMQNGRPVRVKYNIPVKFALDLDQKERKATVIASIRLKTYADNDEPMVIVDNEIKSYDYVKSMDSKDIESIDVLSAANAVQIYGKAAEKGALIIKSKSYKPKIISATVMNKN